MGALGFAFVENIVYLQNVIESTDGELTKVIGVFVVRAVLVIMVHLLCSGIYGYYYGISLFAGPYLQKHENVNRNSIFLKFFRRVLRFSKKTVYKEEKVIEGLIVAMVIHGLYDFILETKLTIGDLLGFVGIESKINFPIFSIVMVLYFIVGFWFLNHLLNEKNNHLKFGLVGTKAMPEEDYVNLLRKVKGMKKDEEVHKKLLEEKWASEDELKELKDRIEYIKKFDLLEQKYLSNKWINKETFDAYKKQVESIKDKQEK